MKQFIFTLILLLINLLSSWGQDNMQIRQLFERDYQHQHHAVEVMVEGKKLKPYKLTLFKSITLSDNPEQIALMEKLVKADALKASDKEVGIISGHLYFGFYRFTSGSKNQYIFFRNQSLRNPHKAEATVVYMEGYATLTEIKNMFK